MTLADHLRTLDVEAVGVHLLPGPERDGVLEACREARKTVVELDALPEVIITADAMADGGIVRLLKDEVDSIVPNARTVIVLRITGDAPLAPTLDAYLDVEMRPGRDVWA